MIPVMCDDDRDEDEERLKSIMAGGEDERTFLVRMLSDSRRHAEGLEAKLADARLMRREVETPEVKDLGVQVRSLEDEVRRLRGRLAEAEAIAGLLKNWASGVVAPPEDVPPEDVPAEGGIAVGASATIRGDGVALSFGAPPRPTVGDIIQFRRNGSHDWVAHVVRLGDVLESTGGAYLEEIGWFGSGHGTGEGTGWRWSVSATKGGMVYCKSCRGKRPAHGAGPSCACGGPWYPAEGLFE